jgi:hypothetical protein
MDFSGSSADERGNWMIWVHDHRHADDGDDGGRMRRVLPSAQGFDTVARQMDLSDRIRRIT